MLADGVIPTELALVHEDGERGGGNTLGEGPDGEEGPLVHGLRPLQLPRPVALEQQDRVVAHEHEREAGDRGGLPHVGHQAVGRARQRRLCGARRHAGEREEDGGAGARMWHDVSLP
jgi:hypothetical protein